MVLLHKAQHEDPYEEMKMLVTDKGQSCICVVCKCISVSEAHIIQSEGRSVPFRENKKWSIYLCIRLRISNCTHPAHHHLLIILFADICQNATAGQAPFGDRQDTCQTSYRSDTWREAPARPACLMWGPIATHWATRPPCMEYYWVMFRSLYIKKEIKPFN